MEARKLKVVRYLYESSDQRGAVVVSRARMMHDLRLSPAQLRAVFAHIEKAGMIRTFPRYAENGGRCENEYYVTSRGVNYVRLSRSRNL